MSNEKKVLKQFGKALDDACPFNKWFPGLAGMAAEAVDGVFFKYAVELGYEHLPDDYKDEALSIMEAFNSGNMDTVADEAIDAFAENIKTPLEDENEKLLLHTLVDIARNYMKDSKARAATVGGGGHGDDPTKG